MPKDEQNNCFDAFAWLIYEEVEKYVNEHRAEFTEEEEVNKQPGKVQDTKSIGAKGVMLHE